MQVHNLVLTLLIILLSARIIAALATRLKSLAVIGKLFAGGVIILLAAGPLQANDFFNNLAKAAIERTQYSITYDGSYFAIAYPNGDVPANIGVCTDVVIRAYRALGIDLQKELHEYLAANFSVYPSKRIWQLTTADKNIDHRRVPNLRVFLSRNGESLPTRIKSEDYHPGDLVTWRLPGNLPHIGVVSNRFTSNGITPLVVHNIGSGPVIENALFRYELTGHYRYGPMDI